MHVRAPTYAFFQLAAGAGFVELRFRDDRFVFSHRLPDAWREQLRLRHLPAPTWDKGERVWCYDEGEDETRAVRFLRDGYRIPSDGDANERIDRLIELYGLRDDQSRDDDLLTKLRPYQREGVEFVQAHKRVLIADAMGLGKSLQALMAIESMDVFPALVVAPASVKLGWQNEVLKWTPWRSCQVMMTGRDPMDDVDVMCINPELLPGVVEDLMEHGFKSIVIDEAHYYKNPKAQRTQLVEMLAHDMDVRIALTGTPIPNRREDILQQLRLIGQLEHFFDPFKGVVPHWWDLHAELPMRYARLALDKLPRDVVHGRLRDTCMIRRTKWDVAADLPAFERVRRELPKGDALGYKRAEREFLDWVSKLRARDERKLFGGDVLVGRQHLADLRREAALSKIASVVEWAEEMREARERVVFFAHHRAVVAALSAALPGKVATITGETNPHTRRVLIDSFGDYAFMVASMDTMGQGVDGLQHHANHVAFVELDWTPTKHEQCEGRLHRIGQKAPVTAWYFTAADTIEGAMLRRIDEKWKDVEGIVDGRIADKFVGKIVKDLLREAPQDD